MRDTSEARNECGFFFQSVAHPSSQMWGWREGEYFLFIYLLTKSKRAKMKNSEISNKFNSHMALGLKFNVKERRSCMAIKGREPLISFLTRAQLSELLIINFFLHPNQTITSGVRERECEYVNFHQWQKLILYPK
jgi:hypothetical protein